MPSSQRLLHAGLLGFLGLWLSCSSQTTQTPARALDRPSDIASYCVDLEVPSCLPQGVDAVANPQGYLDAYCAQTDYAAQTMPTATVLPLDACNDEPARLKVEGYYGAVRQAALTLGRDPNYPCCPPGESDCAAVIPTCYRRVLSGLIANTARGELAVAELTQRSPGAQRNGKLRNLHQGKPGFGFLPVGRLPSFVRTASPMERSTDGQPISPKAWGATANVGSCDLSIVSLQKVAELAAGPANCDDRDAWCPSRECTAESCPVRVSPWLPGPAGTRRSLHAQPAWLEIIPFDEMKKRTAVVAFPTCGLVATVDLGRTDGFACRAEEGCGRITDAIGFDAMGMPKVLSATDLAQIDCPADCGSDTQPSLMPDPMQIPAGGARRSPAYPATLAVDQSGQRLIVGDATGDSLWLVGFDRLAAEGARLLGPVRRLPLDFDVLPESLRGGQRGVVTVRIGPRTVAGQFAYVITRDSSVRVVDLDRELECETNPDPRFLQALASTRTRILPDELNDNNLSRMSCFPIGAGKTPRRPNATGPGILLPNGTISRDVGFVRLDLGSCNLDDPTQCPLAPAAEMGIWRPTAAGFWVGDFGWILGGGGSLAAIQLADRCPQPNYRACFPAYAALHRVALLYTRSQAQPNPEVDNLPTSLMPYTVRPIDRLMNVRRTEYSRSGQIDGTRRTSDISVPVTDADGLGLPVLTARVGGAAAQYMETINDNPGMQRRRLVLPSPASYYQLPVDPVCDVTLASMAEPASWASPGEQRPIEPTRRPVSLVHFTDPAAVANELWTMEWEGALSNLSRTAGRLLSDGTLTDLSGLYCSNGVEAGDKLRLSGCRSDKECLYLGADSLCRREPGQGNTAGMCLTTAQADTCRTLSQRLLEDTSNDTVWAATWERRYRILRAEQQVAGSTGDVLDRLTLDEIAEPEFEVEQVACNTLGAACADPVALPGRKTDVTQPRKPLQCRATGKTAAGTLAMSCVVECKLNADCGVGYVCTHSRYEGAEESAGYAAAKARPRCMRAPLFTEETLAKNGNRWEPLGAAGARDLMAACYPDLVAYQVRAGDSFLMVRSDTRGNNRDAVTLTKRAADGSCQRPAVGDPAYQAARLLEPRLRLGPRDSLNAAMDARRCPARNGAAWISHRVPPSPEAEAQPSCQALYSNPSIDLPFYGRVQIARGKDYDPRTSADPWLASEHELFANLPLQGATNQCILTDAQEEEFPGAATPPACQGDGRCLFPGDHTEKAGVRRIHFETTLGNVVLRLPRVLLDSTKAHVPCKDLTSACNPALWAVPPDEYAVSFVVRGGQVALTRQARTLASDVSNDDTIAHSLRTALAGPGGTLYLVDEGRLGEASGLRGRVMRIVGSLFDTSFVVR